MNVDKYINFDKTALIYHGLGSRPTPKRDRLLFKKGFNIISEWHDYKDEYAKDLGESFFKTELEKAKDVDLIVGVSFGGYVAYNLAMATGKDCIIINGAIDRSRSKTTMTEDFVMDYEKKNPRLESFLGEYDTSVDPQITIDYLKVNNPGARIQMVDKFAHRVPNKFFIKVLKQSNLIN